MNSLTRVFVTVLLAATVLICSSLPAAGSVLSGMVTDTSGQPLKDAVVTLESLDGKTILTMTTARGGLFHFDAVPGGTWSLSAREPNHLFATNGPLIIAADSAVSRNIQLEPPRVLGEDVVSCDQSLISGRVEGLRKTSPAAVQLCMSGERGNRCTHLGTGAIIALYVLPGRYELSLEGPDQQKLLSHAIDASYCGHYEGIIHVLE